MPAYSRQNYFFLSLSLHPQVTVSHFLLLLLHLIMSASSSSVGLRPWLRITRPSSPTVISPSWSASNSENASLRQSSSFGHNSNFHVAFVLCVRTENENTSVNALNKIQVFIRRVSLRHFEEAQQRRLSYNYRSLSESTCIVVIST